MTFWIIGIIAVVAIPTYGGAQDRARARLTAGVVTQEIRRAGQLAFAQGRSFTLDAGSNTGALILTPFGGESEIAIDFTDPIFDSRVLASTMLPYTATLQFDSSGDVVSPVSWDLVSGSTSATVVQETGSTEPVITEIKKTTDTQKEVINQEMLN